MEDPLYCLEACHDSHLPHSSLLTIHNNLSISFKYLYPSAEKVTKSQGQHEQCGTTKVPFLTNIVHFFIPTLNFCIVKLSVVLFLSECHLLVTQVVEKLKRATAYSFPAVWVVV
jgi:hypothetical protein